MITKYKFNFIAVFLIVSGIIGSFTAYAAESVYFFDETFGSTGFCDGANTTLEWNTGDSINGFIRLSKDTESTHPSKQINGKVFLASDNNLYFAWVDFRSGVGDSKGHIYLQKFSRNGEKQWTDDLKVDSAANPYIKDEPLTTIPGIVENNGFIYVYWVINDYLNNYLHNYLYLQKIDTSGVKQWGFDKVVNNTAPFNPVTSYNGGYTPALANSTNQIVFFWDNGTGLYMQKIDENGNRLLASDKEIFHGYVDIPSAVKDSSDNYYVVYSSCVGTQKYLCLNKFSSDGDKIWGNPVVIANSKGINAADVATDSSGNSYVVWDDSRNSDPSKRNVFMRKFNSSGAAQWLSNVKVNSDPGNAIQQNPKIRLDSSGSPRVIWEDQRTSGFLDIYAQEFDTNGTPAWSSETKVNVGQNEALFANIDTGFASNFVIDPANNNIYAAWFTDRNNDYDVFLQKVNSSGAGLWGSDITATQIESGGGFVNSGYAQSTAIDSTVDNILSAIVYGGYIPRDQTIKFYLSNDGGVTWVQTDLQGTPISFVSTGSDLCWKAVFTSTDNFKSPEIYNLAIQYFTVLVQSANNKALKVYDDKWYYPPTGWMAQDNRTDAITLQTTSSENPFSGTVCNKIVYDPNIAAWAGFYSQASAKWRAQGGTGIDLSGYRLLQFRARADATNSEAIEVSFGIGEDGDSCKTATAWKVLSTEWTSYVIDLDKQNLTDVNGVFMVAMRRIRRVDPVFFIDDIKFIGSGPAAINDLKPSVGSVVGSVHLSWTASQGDYANTAYVIKYSTSYIKNKTDFSAAATFYQTWTPQVPGSAESHSITGLVPGKSYYFAVQIIDEKGNSSDVSNVVYYIARTSGLGISVKGVVNLGDVYAGESATGGPIDITNIGGVPATLSLSVSNPPGWTASQSNHSNDHYVMLGAFATSLDSISWDINNHSIFAEPQTSTSSKFAGDQTGANLSMDAARKLWIRFSAPAIISPGTENQKIYINISAETAQ